MEEHFSDEAHLSESLQTELLPMQKKFLGDASKLLEKKTDGATLDPKSAFLLSRIDGMLSADDLLDVSGMPRNETLSILLNLILRGVVESV